MLRLHLHRYRRVGRRSIWMKWEVTERCRCGRERVRVEPKRYAEASEEERAAESAKSRAIRAIGV